MNRLPRTLAAGFSWLALAAAPALAVPQGSAPPYAPPPAFSAFRAPTPSDDAARAYAVGQTWQFGGQSWQNVDSTAGLAAWAPMTNAQGALPVDLIGASAVVACGTVPLKAGFTGPAIDVKTTVGGTATTTTVNILAGGRLDTATLYAALAKQDAGTAGTVSKCYDQTGNANHLAANGTQPGPQIGRVRTLGFDTLSWGFNQGPAALAFPSGLALTQNFSAYLFGRLTAASSSQAGMLFELGQTGSNGTGLVAYINNNANGMTLNRVVAGANNNLYSGFMLDAAPAVTVVAGSSTAPGVALASDDLGTTFASGLAATSYSGGNLGFSAAFASSIGHQALFGFVLTNTSGTAATRSAVAQAAYVNYGIAPQVRDQVVVLGDSRSYGFKTDDGRNWPNQMVDLIGKATPFRLLNLSQSGYTAAQIAASVAPWAASKYVPGVRNIAVVFAGTNDANAGTPTATIVVSLQSICSAMKAAGYTVILVDELQRSDAVSSAITVLRAAIATGSFQADVLVDPLAVPVLSNPANAAYFPDGLHLSTAASGAMAAFMGTAVQNAFGRTR